MPRSANKQQATTRLVLLDEARGFTIISMVLFHAAYDAAYLYGHDLAWFQEPIIQTYGAARSAGCFSCLPVDDRLQ